MVAWLGESGVGGAKHTYFVNTYKQKYFNENEMKIPLSAKRIS